MTRPPLTAELISDDTRRWRLSLQVCPGSLEVVLRPLTPEVSDNDLLWSSIPFAKSSPSVTAAVQEAVYANPLLVAPFGKVDVLVRAARYVFLPAEMAGAAAETIGLLGWDAPDRSSFISAADRLYSVVAMTDSNLLNFLRRTFDSAVPVHPLAVLARWFGSRSLLGNSGKVFVNLSPDRYDVLVYNTFGLAEAASFHAGTEQEMCYYILAAAQTAGLGQGEYEVHISGSPELRGPLTSALRRFVPVVVPAIFPSALLAYGQKAIAAPLELSIMPLCES